MKQQNNKLHQTKHINNIFIVGGLHFGDQGKGTTVEYLTNKYKANLIVRYNGGPQAMHHVVSNQSHSQWHCFAQFGAGTLIRKECRTLLSKYVLINPHTMINEALCLQDKGVKDAISSRIFIDINCIVITPFHKLINQVKQILRGKGNRYGTTGMGVGVAADQAFQAFPEFYPLGDVCAEIDGKKGFATCLRVSDMMDKEKLMEKLRSIGGEKLEVVRGIISRCRKGDQQDIFDDDYVKVIQTKPKEDTKEDDDDDDGRIEQAENLLLQFLQTHTIDNLTNFYSEFYQNFQKNIVDGDLFLAQQILNTKSIVFEGAQGALLDKMHGIYPHITKTLCSATNAIVLIKKIKEILLDKVEIKVTKVGVLRAYSSRHGHGPLVTQDESFKQFIFEQHNSTSKWQGKFRIGMFDFVAAKYGIEIFKPDVLSITCLDQVLDAGKKNQYIGRVPVCCKYVLNGLKDEQVKTIGENFNFENNGQLEVSQIKLKSPLHSYKSTYLLSILLNAEAKVQFASEYSDINIERISYYTEQLKEVKRSKQQLETISKFLVSMEDRLNIPIQIISFGPSQKDKIYIPVNK